MFKLHLCLFSFGFNIPWKCFLYRNGIPSKHMTGLLIKPFSNVTGMFLPCFRVCQAMFTQCWHVLFPAVSVGQVDSLRYSLWRYWWSNKARIYRDLEGLEEITAHHPHCPKCSIFSQPDPLSARGYIKLAQIFGVCTTHFITLGICVRVKVAQHRARPQLTHLIASQ